MVVSRSPPLSENRLGMDAAGHEYRGGCFGRGGKVMKSSPWQTNTEANATSATAADALALFDSTPAAPEASSGPIPAGRYRARLESGALEQSGRGNWCYAVRWQLTGGPYDGYRLVSRHWLTLAAVGRTKQELGALGLTVAHLRGQAAAPPVLAELSVKCRADECGDLYNEVKRVTPAKTTNTVPETRQDGAQGAIAGKDTQIPSPPSGTPEPPSRNANSSSDDNSYLDDEFGEQEEIPYD